MASSRVGSGQDSCQTAVGADRSQGGARLGVAQQVHVKVPGQDDVLLSPCWRQKFRQAVGNPGELGQVRPHVGRDDHEGVSEALDLHSQQVSLARAVLSEHHRNARLFNENSHTATRAPMGAALSFGDFGREKLARPGPGVRDVSSRRDGNSGEVRLLDQEDLAAQRVCT
eukprot:13894577-Alexandrium_andersonii.AAC.1